MELKSGSIKRENLQDLLPDLVNLEGNWVGIGEKAWTEENFRLDLYGKWDLSAYVSSDGKIVAYMICSIEEDTGKLNKILVDKEFRNRGIASMLWDGFLERCRNKGLKRIEFKVFSENSSAIDFYRKQRCLIHGKDFGSDKRMRFLCRYVFRSAKRIGHSKPTISKRDIEAVSRCLGDGDIATGNIVKRFTSSVCSFIGRGYGLAVNNGTSALFLALKALGVKAGDEIIVPSYVCGSVLSAVLSCSAKPVIVDINKEDYNLSLEDTKKKITRKTKAVIAAHMFGSPVKDIEDFLSLKIPVIEDCAMSIGACHKEKKVGSFGTLSVFSFYATKLICSGVGGMVLTDDKAVLARLNDLSKYDKREVWGENYNCSMSDLQAALGLSQLKRIDSFVKRRKEIAKQYTSMFKDADFSFPGEGQEGNVFFRYLIESTEKDLMVETVKKRGVDLASPVYRPLHSYLGFPDKDFPNASKAHKYAVSIPIYPGLSAREVEEIASILINWRKEL